MFNYFKKVENNNLDCPDKPVGATKKMIIAEPAFERIIVPGEIINLHKSGLFVSIALPCDCAESGSREYFKKYGYMIIKGLWDPKEFQESVPDYRGQINYYGKVDKFTHNPVEMQVKGSLARYNHPKFKYAHSQIRLKLQKILGEDLYNTYYYDRFYFSGQRLYRHTDRDACEISLTYQISSNSKKPWPICFQTPDGEERYVELNDGDAVLYKGCEIDHWREPLPSNYNRIQKLFKEDDTYHHQVFFHYVLANGFRSHYASDIQ